MKSKIEKIESVYDLYDGDRNVDANKLKDILNNIIEALNSQSQPEEKKQRVGCEYSDCYRCPECNDELLVTCLHPLELLCTRCREYVEIEDVVEKATYVCAKGEFEVKDTPEEWGELKEILDEYTIYADCFPTTPTNAVKARKNLENKIQQLLEDKEREVVQKVVNETRNMERLSIKQGISGEKAMKRLRNLIESLYELNLLKDNK